jgi:ubiquinone/menaquinone biosynthesis C-methylase UbiE
MNTKPTILPARVAKSQVSYVYQGIAPIYDVWGGLTEGHPRRRCLELAHIQDGETILEVAVGTGLLFEQILKRNPHGQNYGIDLTPEMLARAELRANRTGNPHYHLDLGDAYQLHFENESFDLLINNFMFDLLPESDFSTVLTELKRVLKPGGRLVLANMTKPERWVHGLYEAIYRINPAWMGGCRGVLLLDHLHKAGFVHNQREYLSQLGFPSEIVICQKPKSILE